MGVWGRDPGRTRGKAPKPLWRIAPEADDTFCENMPFCHDFKNDIAISAFTAYKSWI